MKKLTMLGIIITISACSNYEPTAPSRSGWGTFADDRVTRQFVVGGVITVAGRAPDSARIYLPSASAEVTHREVTDTLYQIIGWVETSNGCEGLRVLAEVFADAGGQPLASGEAALADCPANHIDFRFD